MADTWADIQKANIEENDQPINILIDEPFRSYQLSKIYEFYECRNSYNSSTSTVSMFNNFGFHFNVEVIKQRIESNRKMGSWFEINEVPCIAIKGTNKTLILFSKTNNRFSFKSLENQLSDIKDHKKFFKYDQTTLKDFYESLKNLNRDLNFFVMDTDDVDSFELPIKAYKSKNKGSNYYLTYKNYGISRYGQYFFIENLLKSFILLDHKTNNMPFDYF
jgi:hypothetical protein